MQRLFSMFPSGPPGVALLLLRLSVAFGLFFDPRWAGTLALALLYGGVAAVLALGLLTPLAAAAAALLVLSGGGIDVLSGLLLANALSLGLIGPGAYAVDARLFGRRIVVFRSGGD
jgi:hypothetical protein